ncbi:MAG: MFS transporter, partial [Pseudomonadota bacterium]|nr:MFS transporter [Pseudomonadota bacterium]
MLTAILFGFCLVPIALGSKGAPPNIDAERIGLRDLYRFSPVGVVGAAAAGFTNAPLMGLGPVFGAKVGLGIEGVF